jgi:hypothetical protein
MKKVLHPISSFEDLKIGSVIQGIYGYRMIIAFEDNYAVVSDLVELNSVPDEPAVLVKQPKFKVRKYIYTIQDIQWCNYQRVTFTKL